MLPARVYHEIVDEAGDDFASLELIVFSATWETSGRLTLPREVVTHVLDNGSLEGLVFIRPTPDELYLWNNDRRLREVSRIRSNFSEILPT